MTQQLPVLVAGGGIGGLAAALTLVRQGFQVKLLEQAGQIGEIGAGIQLGPNAFHAFESAAQAGIGLALCGSGQCVTSVHSSFHPDQEV